MVVVGVHGEDQTKESAMNRETKRVAKAKKAAGCRRAMNKTPANTTSPNASGEWIMTKEMVCPTDPRQLFEKYEPLRRDLRKFVTPFSSSTKSSAYGMFQHPWFIGKVYSLDHCAYIHHMMDQQQHALIQFNRRRRFRQVVMAQARPYRLQMLANYEHNMTARVFWKTFADVWMDSENLWQDTRLIRRMLSSPRPHRDHAMTAEERRALKKMPDTLTIYRGFSGEGTPRGWSWTVNREKGEWFARRPPGPLQDSPSDPTLVEATVKKADVIAYFTGRNEWEIVVDPRKVKIVSTTVLKPKKKSAPVKLTDWLKPQMEKAIYGQKA